MTSVDSETVSAAISMIVSLLVILGGLVVCAFLIKKYKNRVGLDKTSGGMKISILSTRSLGMQQSLVVAEADGKYFLLGICKAGITLISRLDSHE